MKIQFLLFKRYFEDFPPVRLLCESNETNISSKNLYTHQLL
jgi:hypothetical protein